MICPSNVGMIGSHPSTIFAAGRRIALNTVLHYLPTVNATLNATATVLLIWGYRLIKGRPRRETAHKRVLERIFTRRAGDRA